MVRQAIVEQRPRLVDVVTSLARARSYRASGLWDDSTIAGQVARHARERSAALAVVDLLGRRRTTYDRLERDSNKVAHFLAALGVETGDIVAVQLPNWYEAVAVMLGVLKAGAVLNPMLTIYRAKELRHMLTVGHTRVIFTPQLYRGFDHRELVADVAKDLPHQLTHVTVADPELEPDAFAHWLSGLPEAPLDRAQCASSVSELIFTSGTEAEPKAIMHTEETINFCARSEWTSLGMRPDDIVWVPAPIGHATGFNHGVRMALYFGLKLVLQDRWNAADAVALIASERCTYTLAAPTFLNDVIRTAEAGGCDLSSMRLFTCGGAPVPQELVVKGTALGIGVLRLYGATEALVVSCNRPSTPAEKRVTTDGPPLDGVEVEVRGASGERGVVGSPGEVFTRSPGACVGFFNDPERTSATFDRDGWVRSGDLGIVDAQGHLTIIGRRKEIIIRGGLNIAPREIEELILSLPEVAAAAVIGLPDERLGETTCACVVLKSGCRLTLESLVAYLKSCGMAVYKLPQRLEVVESLPMTPTGKIRKHLLVSALLAKPAAAIPPQSLVAHSRSH